MVKKMVTPPIHSTYKKMNSILNTDFNDTTHVMLHAFNELCIPRDWKGEIAPPLTLFQKLLFCLQTTFVLLTKWIQKNQLLFSETDLQLEVRCPKILIMKSLFSNPLSLIFAKILDRFWQYEADYTAQFTNQCFSGMHLKPKTH